jgi:hypothetical protein
MKPFAVAPGSQGTFSCGMVEIRNRFECTSSDVYLPRERLLSANFRLGASAAVRGQISYTEGRRTQPSLGKGGVRIASV